MRTFFFWLHFAAGLVAGLIIFLMALTGVLMAFEPQILDHFEADYRQVPETSTSRLPLASLMARAEADLAGSEISAVTLWSDPNRSVLVQLGRDKQAYFDPGSGANLGAGSAGLRSFFRTVLGLHRWLGFNEALRGSGRWVTGASNLAFVFLCLSGLYLWWPRRWSLNYLRSVTLFRGGLQGKARYFNWHNVLGLWSLPILLALSLTGVVISYPWARDLLYSLSGSPVPPERGRGPEGGARERPARGEAGKRDARQQGRRGPERERGGGEGEGGPAAVSIDYEGILAQVDQRLPGWQKLTLRLPRRAGEPLKAQVYRQDSARPDHRQGLSFSPGDAKLVEEESYAGQSAGAKLRSWVRPVHTGEAGGVIGQLLAALASAVAVVLVWTGMMLAWYRLFKRKRSQAAA